MLTARVNIASKQSIQVYKKTVIFRNHIGINQMKNIYTYLTIVLFTTVISTSAFSQSINDLKQRVSVDANNVTITELLENIGAQAQIKFSYNPKLIKSNRRVTFSAENTEVRKVLNDLFEDEFDYKLRGKYVIIVKKSNSERTDTELKKTILSGFIIDSETKEGIENVSVFTAAGESTLSDVTGAFEIQLKKSENSQVELRKRGYAAMYYETNHTSNTNVEIGLDALKSLSVQLHRDSISAQRLNAPNIGVATMYSINTILKINQENIQDSIDKPVSFSLYPGVATYGNLSGNIKFNLALNFIGYNRGIDGAEFSIFSSINRDNVVGVQLAGLSNYVGKGVTGFQAAGIFNKVGADLIGVQMGGIANVNFGDVKGAQYGGISNHVVGDVTGVQYAGIYNRADDVTGVQGASIINLADTLSGVQMSGVANISNQLTGVQMASVFNYADTIKGAQFSGLVNSARVVKGSQIGIINIADTLTGVPIGLFNFIKNGYKRVGVYSDDLFPLNVEFRSGVDHFYTILNGGVQSDIGDSDSALYTFGMGLGSRILLSPSAAIEIEATGNQINKRESIDVLSLNIRGYLGLEYKIGDHFAIAGGATYNAFLFDRELLLDEDFNQLKDSYLIDTSDQNDNYIWRSWLGYKAGVRFVF